MIQRANFKEYRQSRDAYNASMRERERKKNDRKVYENIIAIICSGRLTTDTKITWTGPVVLYLMGIFLKRSGLHGQSTTILSRYFMAAEAAHVPPNDPLQRCIKCGGDRCPGYAPHFWRLKHHKSVEADGWDRWRQITRAQEKG
ncbi:hypothetical protein OUZ56_004783 [Daphnia magna]|uniref:Uncharacterized protein n=1 Tax=Daphnia magna TaxID=35525 RepID=A0ABQ9YR10_9CRUS|nr:hypothetical protein OUZ56_004783 [Daphnia magna]